MFIFKKINHIHIFITILILTGCGNTPVTHYYTLRADNSASPTKQNLSVYKTNNIGIGPLVMPSSLENFSVISVEKNNQIIIDPYHLWSGDLKTNINQVLADNLSNILGVDGVWAFPWDNRNRPKIQVRIAIEQFMGERGGDITLQAKWTLLGDYGKEEIRTEKTRIIKTLTSDDYLSYVQGLNAALNEFSMTIANALSEE